MQRKKTELYKFFQLKVIILQNILKKKPDEGQVKQKVYFAILLYKKQFLFYLHIQLVA